MDIGKIKGVLTDNTFVLMYFRSNACAPCSDFEQKIDLLFSEDERLQILKLDVEKYPGVPAQFQVFSTPVLIFFVEGKEIFRKGLYSSPLELKDIIEGYIRKYEEAA